MLNTIFYQIISEDKEKLIILNDAIKDGLVTSFNQELISRLRRIYYACLSGLLYIYTEPTNTHTIGNKVEILSMALESEDYEIVHGDTDSSLRMRFMDKHSKELDFNSWIEVKKGNKVWVYDPFSLLRIEKDTYYKLEHPIIKQRIPKSAIISHPGREEEDYKTIPHDLWVLAMMMPRLEKLIEESPYRDFLTPELTRYKEQVDYETVELDYRLDEYAMHHKKI